MTRGLKEQARELVDLATKAASAYERTDLLEEITKAGEHLERSTTHVVVLGEHKMGKSSLINALVGAEACPAHEWHATTVATVVRGADQAAATVVFDDGNEGDDAIDDASTKQTVAFENLRQLVTEAGNPGNRHQIHMVEVDVPSPVLGSGLVLVDTPGTGGLGSPESASVLAAATHADGIVFVTAADQELTEPEMDLLRSLGSGRLPLVIAVNRCDLQVQWRRIVDVNRAHLRDGGIEAPVVGVSCELRRIAMRDGDADLNEESGFLDLATLLRSSVIDRVDEVAADAAAEAVHTAATAMRDTFAAEHAALSDPQSIEELERRLTEARLRAERLREQGARWQQRLNDGLADLTADVDHDLRQRLRSVMADIEEAIDESDPAESHEALASWLERRLTGEVIENFRLLAERTEDVAHTVGETFDDEAMQVRVAPVVDADRVSQMVDLGVDLDRGPGRDTGYAQSMALVRGSYMPFAIAGMAIGFTGVGLLMVPAVGVSALMGGKSLREEKQRQLGLRRQQAKAAVRKYVDDVSFRVSKDSRDSMRRTQRMLRDTLSERATSVLRSAEDTLRAAQQAVNVEGEQRSRRIRDLEAEVQRLDTLITRAGELRTQCSAPRAGDESS